MAGPRKFRISKSLFQGIAVGVIGALLVGGAVVAAGFDVKQTPLNDASIWALQSGEGNRYARVNTELGELDTIKTVRNPSALAQSPEKTLLFAQNNEQLVDIDAARPLDFDAEGAEYTRTPAGTVQVVTSHDTVAYRTSTGSIFVASLSDGAAAVPVAVDPFAADEVVEGAERRFYRSDAIALSDDGTLVSYSAADQSVMRYSVADAEFSGVDPVVDAPTDSTPQITIVGESWALVAESGEQLWVQGRDAPIELALSETFVVQHPSSSGRRIYIADERGLYAVTIASGEVEQIVGDTVAFLGAPAQPLRFQGEMYGAWLPTGAARGTLWSSAEGAGEAGLSELNFGGLTLSTDAQPVFQSNGSRLILNDIQSGWVWTLPDGALVASSQNWGVLSAEQEETTSEEEQTAEVLDPKPPVAEPDNFGVRAGQLIVLPVLLNDHDPNTDVLTILPSSLTELPAEFGSLSVIEQSQSITVRVADDAVGSATFSYAVTDGTRADGLNSEATTVTLSVHDELSNAAPQWCGTEGCLAEWPSPQVMPGGTVTVPVLSGWVDPDGDPFFVANAVNQSGVGSVGVTPAGEVVYRHPNPSATEAATISISVTVSDTRGASTERILSIVVTPAPTLTATPFALTTAAGESITVDPSSFLHGVSGSYRIVSATAPPTAQGVAVTVNSGASTFDFSATTPGDYLVRYSVSDASTEVQSFVRVTVLAADAAGLSTTPVTVFVRPQADASVDVFTAVSNPAGRVLLVSDPLPLSAPGAALEVGVVGQNLLRVRGTTADGQPGPLGVVQYTVSDGTSDPRFSVQGQATVYLLPAPTPQPPIAVADTVVVRAATQIDIPVLSNDVAPDGNRMVLNPDTVVNQSDKGLAFASGDTLRYLAPTTAGSYELRYTISIAGAPELTDTASVMVTVTPDGENQKPLPRALTGRVLSGETVSIPFSSFGIDPDGDDVSLDRILGQPSSGTASISATGDAIVYSSVKGFRGPVQFEYRVRDAHGDTGVAMVRIGVLDAQSDPSPITFSDYVQVQAGEESQVVLQPAANDIDPSGGKLTLTSVSPDALQNGDEYAALASHIVSHDDQEVVLKAGAEPGTMAFSYTVENSRGDVGVGLIVMKVVRASIPDHPIVVDTVVTLEDREKFSQGIDVVTGKVSWTSGDVNNLKLSIWGDDQGVRASGWNLKGKAPDAGLLLPFVLTGTNFAGAEVTSYGFLRVPAVQDVILSLKPDLAPQKVKEAESVTFDMASLVAIPDGEVLELGRGGVAASGQRAAGLCRLESSTRVSYEAGEGQPWTDSCIVPVRLAGGDDYTHLVVPIEITPKDPQPELRPASVTVSPAAPAVTYDLGQMVQWQGKADPASLVFVTEQAADQFTVTQEGSRVTVKALDTAVPGRENLVTVKLSSHPNTPPAVLSLRVGPAPSSLPKGGTVAKECSQASGTGCVIDAIGAAGEVNVYTSTPLKLVGVTAANTCAGVTFAVENGKQLRASWSGDTPGGICTASFVVEDAQGKRSAAERNGSVTLDLQGFPRAPNSVTQTAYANGSVTLAVNPGEATSAHPNLQGFKLFVGGAEVGKCSASGVCDPIAGLENGKKSVFEARAFNSVGNSQGAVNTTAWSYDAPGVGEVSATPAYDAAVTSASQGVASLKIQNTDASTRGYVVNGTRYDATGSGNGTTDVTLTLGVGQQLITVQPVSRFERPPGAGPADQQRTTGVRVAGLPDLTVNPALSATESTITVPVPSLNPNSSERANELSYIATAEGGQGASCSVGGDGTGLNARGTVTSQSPVISLPENLKLRNVNVEVCYSNGFGVVQKPVGTIFTWDAPAAPSGFSYAVQGNNGRFSIQTPTSSQGPPSFRYETVFTGLDDAAWGADPNISVKYCVRGNPERCSPAAAVPPADPTRAWQISFDSVTIAVCRPSSALGFTANGLGMTGANPRISSTGYEYFVPGTPGSPEIPGTPEIPAKPDIDPVTGQPIPGTGTPLVPAKPGTPAVPAIPDKWSPAPADGIVPADATKVRSVKWTLSWTAAQVSGLGGPLTGTINQETACHN